MKTDITFVLLMTALIGFGIIMMYIILFSEDDTTTIIIKKDGDVLINNDECEDDQIIGKVNDTYVCVSVIHYTPCYDYIRLNSTHYICQGI